LEKTANTLIEKETIEREEFENLVKGKREKKKEKPTQVKVKKVKRV